MATWNQRCIVSTLLLALSLDRYGLVVGDRLSYYGDDAVVTRKDYDIDTRPYRQFNREQSPNGVQEMQPGQQLLVLNEYLDATLLEIRESPHLREVLDPLRLDKEPFRFRHGRIHDVRIGSLLSLHRQGNVSLFADEGILLADLAVTNLNIFFQYEYSLVSPIKFEGRFDGSLEKLAATLHIKLAEHTSDLLYFKVVEVGRCKVHRFTGASRALNWAVRRALQYAINSNRDRIRRKVENALRPVIEAELRKVSLEKIIANVLH